MLAMVAAGLCGCTAQSHNAEGVRMFQQAHYQGALQHFQQAIQADPNNADAYYNLAATYHRMGELQPNPAYWQQAESYYHQCLDRAPNQQDCYRGLAVLLKEENRSQDAFRLMEGWAARNPSMSAPKIELARLFEESGDRESAKQQLIEAVAVDPNNAKSLAALGKLREESGDPVQALANYQRSLALNRFQPQVSARVASLQSSFAPMPQVTPPGGTRTVAVPPTPMTPPAKFR